MFSSALCGLCVEARIEHRCYDPRMRTRSFVRMVRRGSMCVAVVSTLSLSLTAASAPDWSRFRGPNGSGISTATNVPIEFGPQKNLVWRLALPPGHSSPILQGDRIYLTAFRGDALVTFAID